MLGTHSVVENSIIEDETDIYLASTQTIYPRFCLTASNFSGTVRQYLHGMESLGLRLTLTIPFVVQCSGNRGNCITAKTT